MLYFPLICDVARNVLLYTLLLDDADGSNHPRIWNAYYHIFLDLKSLELVHLQAKKLHEIAMSMENWHDSEYGKVLRFCDTSTLKTIREIWRSMSTLDLTDSELEDYDKAFKAYIKRSSMSGGDVCNKSYTIELRSYRSTQPLRPTSKSELLDLHEYYWKHGTTDYDPTIVSVATYSNPMFACLASEMSTMYHATNPLFGFHLATAHMPLSRGSPLRLEAPPDSNPSKLIEAARLQFQSWSATFRKRAEEALTLRFCFGDALAFCSTLEYNLTSRETTSAHLYRNVCGFEPLILDSEDYIRRGQAPLLFDVIDSCNLVDHVGAINVLVAASPLLKRVTSATFYTESLTEQAPTYQELISNTICGDLPTNAVLLGLFPVEYYANASAASTHYETSEAEAVGDNIFKTVKQMLTRIIWKRPISGAEKIHFDDSDLSRLLHKVYREMFRGDDFERLKSSNDNGTKKFLRMATYHRGSFAALLRRIKSTIAVDWVKMMESLKDLLIKDGDASTAFYFEELCVHLHILGIYSMPPFEEQFHSTITLRKSGGFEAWKDIPSVLCITLEVPRVNLHVPMRALQGSQAATQLHCILQTADGYRMFFEILQLSFGKISTSGERNSASYKVNVAEDKSGWVGDSSLIVSFYVPTKWILHDPHTTKVIFAIKGNKLTAGMFDEGHGHDKSFYGTTLNNPNNVFITDHPPGQSDYPTVPRRLASDPKDAGSPVSLSISARLNRESTKIVAFIRRIDVVAEDEKSLLRHGAAVSANQASPCAIDAIVNSFTSPSYYYRFKYPSPVQCTKIKIRTVRASSYIEIKVPIWIFAAGKGFPDFMHPLFLRHGNPILMNMPHLDLEQLPIVNLTTVEDKIWLANHMALQFSIRQGEQNIRPINMRSKDIRADFKLELARIFANYTALNSKKKATVFVVTSRTREWPQFIFVASSMRLDLANRTVVLDAAVLPVSDGLLQKNSYILTALDSVSMHEIVVNDDELVLWKKAVPAWVERCRDWKHTAECEYKIKRKIPLTLEKGQTPLCSCGNGILPQKFGTRMPTWGSISKHAVRVAISPCFSVQYVDPS